MMKTFALLTLTSLSAVAFGQGKTIYVYDLLNDTFDSIPPIDYDASILSENTTFHLGDYNDQFAALSNEPPTMDTYANSEFSIKETVASDFDVTHFPIRTSVKIFSTANGNDSLIQNCSGQFISKRHVLTAAHCITPVSSNELYDFDSLFAAPIYDDGALHPDFAGSMVSKVYFFKDWSLIGEDMAVLELVEPIGESAGWLGVGFNSNDDELLDGIFYKFSYPAVTNLNADPNEFNGDSLYYSYGIVNDINESWIGVQNVTGIIGDSGSSLIKIENELNYTTYGTMSLALNLKHSRINDWRYFAIKSIIQGDILSVENHSGVEFNIYPNPASDIVNVVLNRSINPIGVKVFDNRGRLCIDEYESSNYHELNVSSLADGLYIIQVETSDVIITKKFVKEAID